jgi:hypothetical protein
MLTEEERQPYADCSTCSGLINPSANQRKINVGSHAWGSGMTTMIVIVFTMGLALLLAYFIR